MSVCACNNHFRKQQKQRNRKQKPPAIQHRIRVTYSICPLIQTNQPIVCANKYPTEKWLVVTTQRWVWIDLNNKPFPAWAMRCTRSLIAIDFFCFISVPDWVVPLCLCWIDNQTKGQMVLSEMFTGSQEEINKILVPPHSYRSIAFYFILHHNKHTTHTQFCFAIHVSMYFLRDNFYMLMFKNKTTSNGAASPL